MNKLLFSALALMSLVAFSSVSAQKDKVVKSIIEIGTTDNQTMEHLDVLSNRIGGRLIGSDGYENASVWCASQLKKWGMEVEMEPVVLTTVPGLLRPWRLHA